MKPIEIIASDLFDKVRSRFTNLQMGDESGSVTADPAQARFFDFDFAIEGVNLGRVSISINETGNLKVYYSQGITENTDGITQTMWYDFLKEMRFFAKRRLLRFDTRDISKGNLDKTDFQYLAQNGPKDNNMNESALTGSSRTSHRKLENTDLIIRHSEPIDPNQKGARSRKIKNLFIQNAEGERFKFPFVYLPGARAMQRHVANGGYPHDAGGKHIIKCCEEILKLSDFGRKVKHSTLNDNAHGIIERAGQKLKSLRNHMECMSKQGYYESWAEGFNGDEENVIEMDDATMESYKDAFTVNKFDEALAEVFPLLHAIMQEAGEIDLEDVIAEGTDDKCTCDETGEEDCPVHGDVEESVTSEASEFAAFESWASALEEGTLEPDTLMNLKDFLEQNPEMTLGADGTEAIEALQGVGVMSDALEDLISAKVQMQDGSNIPLKDVVGEWLMQDDPEAAQELGLAPQQAPAPEQDPAMAQQAPVEEPAVAEGPNRSDVPAYMRKAKGEKPLTPKDVADEPKKNISHPDALRRNSGREQDEDHIEPGDEEPLIEKGASNEEIWQAVEGFLDKEKGTWTKGRPGIVAHCNREFGEAGGKKAAKAIMILSKKYPMKDDHQEDEGFIGRGIGGIAGGAVGSAAGGALGTAVGGPIGGAIGSAVGDVAGTAIGAGLGDGDDEEKESVEKLDSFEAIMRLAGLSSVTEAKKTMSRAAKGNEKYGKDGMKALAKAGREGASEKTLDAIRDKHDKYNEATSDYSAKKAAAGKDIGKPGKNFEKIAKKSGGGEKGKKIAGAVLAKLRKG